MVADVSYEDAIRAGDLVTIYSTTAYGTPTMCWGQDVMMFKVPALIDFIIYSSRVHKKSTQTVKNKIISSDVECFEEIKDNGLESNQEEA